MEQIQDTEVDDVDRERLVKEIELIQQTLGGASNRAHLDDVFNSSLIDEPPTERASDDSDDELAIIKSPEYQDHTDGTFGTQHIPAEIITCESDDDILETTVNTTVPVDSDFSPDESISYEISQIVLLNTETDAVPLTLIHVTENPVKTTEDQGSSDNQALSSPEQSSLCKESECYTLTEPQPVENIQQFQSSSLATFDHPSDIESCVVTTDAEERSSHEVENVLSDEEDSEELNEQQRCLKLNRRYQALIEAELKKIEKLILENKEQQLDLGQMSSISSSETEALEFKQLNTFANPYFKLTRSERPDENEDTKHRKSLNQPNPYQKPPKKWTEEEKKTLSDAVRSDVLQAKLTPLLRRVEAITPKKSKTEEEEKELEDLMMQIHNLKNLPLAKLVENFNDLIDFEDISNKMLPQRTPHQCQVFWHNELHPLLNKGKWTKEEDKSLLKLAQQYSGGGSWSKIACELRSNRSPTQCLRRYQRSLNKNFLKTKWDAEDEKKLLEAVNICGLGTWEKVSSFLDGFTGAQCMHRYKAIAPGIRKGKWDDEEDDLLRKGIGIYGCNWIKIRKLLPRRSGAQIRERWQDVIDPNLLRAAWSKEEDGKLVQLVEQYGVGNWCAIAKHIPGRTDNKCRQRWFVLKKDDPKTKDHISKRKITKAKLVNNFSRRRGPVDKPEIGPEDFDISELSETENDSSHSDTQNTPVAGHAAANVATADDNVDCGTSVKVYSLRKSAKATRKTRQVIDSRNSGTQNRKQTRRLKCHQSSDVSSPEKPREKNKSSLSNKRKTIKDKNSPQLASPVTPSHTNQKQPLKSVKRIKLTTPSPAVVSQACALPNVMPMSSLTQFSVLLQAFHVDVSGALKNVSSPGAVTPLVTTDVTSAATPPTEITTPRTLLQTNSTNNNVSSHVSPSAGNSLLKCSTLDGLEQPRLDTNANKEVSDPSTGEPNELSMVLSSVSNSANASDCANARAPGEGIDATETNARCSDRKRRRDNSVDSHAVGKNDNEAKDDGNQDGLEHTGEDPKVLLSDRRHGLRHDIFVLPKSPSYEKTGEITNTPERQLRGRLVQSSPTIQTKRQRKGSGAGARGRKPHGEMPVVPRNEEATLGDIEQVETSPRRYPKRSSRRQPESYGHNVVETMATDKFDSEPPGGRQVGETASPTSVARTCIDNSSHVQIARVIVDSTHDVPQVPAIPPLPPSATTLNAFKKLLTLRKDLQSQASRLHGTQGHNKQAPNPQDTQNERPSSSNGSTLTPGHSAMADHMLRVSSAKQTSQEEFCNSVPYQQLLNRFKGLFMWPGFLSIVNPSFVKPRSGANPDPGSKQGSGTKKGSRVRKTSPSAKLISGANAKQSPSPLAKRAKKRKSR